MDVRAVIDVDASLAETEPSKKAERIQGVTRKWMRNLSSEKSSATTSSSPSQSKHEAPLSQSYSAHHCCYLLRSCSTVKRLYIGYTSDPSKRLRQHNGLLKYGAKKTTRNRPWEMVCVIYGFKDKVMALQFEWAWQHPGLSRRGRLLLGDILNFSVEGGVAQTWKNTKWPTEVDHTNMRASIVQTRFATTTSNSLSISSNFRFTGVCQFPTRYRHHLAFHVKWMLALLALNPFRRMPLKVFFVNHVAYKVFENTEQDLPSHIGIQIGRLENFPQLLESAISNKDGRTSQSSHFPYSNGLDMPTSQLSPLKEGYAKPFNDTLPFTRFCTKCGSVFKENERFTLCPECYRRYHIPCIGKLFIPSSSTHIIPDLVQCCSCNATISWPDCIRFLNEYKLKKFERF